MHRHTFQLQLVLRYFSDSIHTRKRLADGHCHHAYGYRWSMYVRKKTKHKSDYLAVYLRAEQDPLCSRRAQTVAFELSGEIKGLREDSDRLSLDRYFVGLKTVCEPKMTHGRRVVSLSRLCDPSLGLLHNDTVVCELTISAIALNGIPVVYHGWPAGMRFVEYRDVNECRNRVSLQARKRTASGRLTSPLRLDDDLRDFIVISADNHAFACHRCVLAQNEIFRAYMSDVDECGHLRREVHLPETSADVLRRLLNYVYTGEPKRVRFDGVLELLYAAEFYNLPSLKEASELSASRLLDSENVLRVLTLADALNALSLKRNCRRYVTKHTNDVMSSCDWSRFAENHSDLLSFLSQELQD